MISEVAIDPAERDRAVALLSELVACPSVNPLRQLPEREPFGEERMVALLQRKLESWGAAVEIQEVLPRRCNLIARFPGKADGPTLMLEAHSDTVQVEGMTIPPFEPRFDGKRLWGRGSCDTKGSMASMLLAIEAVLSDQGTLPGPLVFVSTCDEELGALGAHHLMASGFQADFAIVGEPTDLSIIHAHKGALRWKLTTAGVAGHSSNPAGGVNAIYRMAQIINHIDEGLASRLARKVHPLLGSPTISVGKISGGTQVNIIPDHCQIEIDRRVVPGEDRGEVTRQLIESVTLPPDAPGAYGIDVEATEWFPPFEEDPGHLGVKSLARAVESATGTAVLGVVPWAANAGVFKQGGIPCAIFGPGSIKNAHTKDESVDVNEVVLAGRILENWLRNGLQ